MTIAIGASLNATGILLGALFGFGQRRPYSTQTQLMFRNILGGFTIFFGFCLVWLNLNGAFLSCIGQLFLALLAVVLGNLLGKALGLQKISNHLGHLAALMIATAQKEKPQNPTAGFNACAILFCVAPLGILGAINDGLSRYFWLLALKAVMDALAMTSFVKIFRWSAVMSVFPVFLLFSLITLACRIYAVPPLESSGLIASIGVASGLITCSIAIVIFELRKVELANYLPGVAIAPLLILLIRVL